MPPVHDYVIDNSTGANVRADINNALAAIVSNNSSSSEPSTKYAYMWWADTTNGILKIRNSANDGWVELLQLDGTLTLEDGSKTTPALAFRDDLNTGIFSSAADTFNVATAGVERMELGATTIFNEEGADVDFRIESDTKTHMFFLDAGNNRIGINSSSPSSIFSIQDTATAGDGITEALRLISSSNTNNDGTRLAFARSGVGTTASIDAKKVETAANETEIIFSSMTAGSLTEKARIDGQGRLLIGLSTSATTDSNAHSRLQAVTTAGPNFLLGRDDSDTAINSRLGVINFGSNHGGTFHEVVTIRAAADAQHASNSKASRLELYTTGTGSTTSTRRMTIDKDGVTHFGGTDSLNDSNVVSIIPADGRISFGMDGRNSLVTGENGCYIFSGSGASGDILAGELVLQSRANTNRDMHFATGSTPTMRGRFRGSDGDFFLGNDLGSITNVGTAFRENDSGGNTYMEMGHGTTGAAYSYFICRFGASGTNIGGIAQLSAGNGVTFNTSSDYRLKTNEALITDGITRIKQLKPYRFEWKSDLGTKVDGFFAHEVSSVVPEAITGEKDAVETTYYEDDEKHIPEGKSIGDVKETDRPVYQAIDHSKLVPLLVAAVQELTARVETLEAA